MITNRTTPIAARVYSLAALLMVLGFGLAAYATGSVTLKGHLLLVLGGAAVAAVLTVMTVRGALQSQEAEAETLAALQREKLAMQRDYQGRLDAISSAQVSAEFTLDGVLTDANENFLRAFGYSLAEIKGKPHSLLVDAADRDSHAYRDFWQRLVRGDLKSEQCRRVTRDGRELWLQSMYALVVDEHGKPAKVVKYATDITQQHAENQLNAAFKGALQKLSSNVMVADPDGRIVYANSAVMEMLATAQTDFRKDLPSFDVAKVVGSNFDVYHKNPAHQRNLLGRLTDTHRTQTVIGGRTMRLVANPMYDAAGRRLGTVVEWFDHTVEVSAQAEVQQVVDAVTEGDFTRRIVIEGKTGFYQSLSVSLNGLIDAMGTVVKDTETLVAAANAGDLTRRVQLEGKPGLLVKIGTGLNQLTDNLADVVSQVKVAASEVSRGADEISQGNTDLSQRTEEQASSLEETASSMEQMTSTVKQNADNAGQANQLAVAARDQAEKGGAVVSRAVRAMAEINDASKKIADIIVVIDEIAFQTNLLALNAAVEAARAGEQGRGFAVVASEVRNLAGRSATAAKEIKALIQDSVRKVDEGAELVTQSGMTLEQIVTAVKKVTDIVAEIAAASQEQSAGIEQVNKAVMQLDELTQQNAALVEEASAASQSMAEQARGLNATMSGYRVNDSDLARNTAVARPAASASVASKPKLAGTPIRSAAERRKAPRPWAVSSKPAATPRPAMAAKSAADLKPVVVSKPAVKLAAGGGNDDDVWKEF